MSTDSDRLISLLRETSEQPIPTPSRGKAWDRQRITVRAANELGLDLEEASALLEEVCEQLGGGRDHTVYPRDRGQAPLIKEHFWVSKDLLYPEERPASAG